MDERTRETVEALEEAKGQIEEALDSAERALRGSGMAWERARSYWLAHVRTALSRDHEYLGSSMVTMQDTIDELTANAVPECEECGEAIPEEDRLYWARVEDRHDTGKDGPSVCRACADELDNACPAGARAE